MTGTTKDGRALSFKFYRQDPNDACGQNRGYVVRRVDALLDDRIVGYIKISYLASELLPTYYPTVWHAFRARGTCFDPDDLAETWVRCHHARHMPESLQDSEVSLLGLQGHQPDEATMRADLDALADKPFGCLNGQTPNEELATLHKTADHAFVDFIRVNERLHRQGIGTALYNEGAKWLLREFGLMLHSSGLQSEEAAATWEAMRLRGLYPVRQVPRIHDGKIVYALDYRSH